MKRSILSLVCSGAVLAGGATAAQANPTQVCTGTVSNMTIDGNVWVPKGSVCKLDNVTVSGSVFGEDHASVIATNTRVAGMMLTKAGGYLNAWRTTAGRIDLDGSWGAYLNDVSVARMGDVRINGPQEGSPSNWVRPNVYVENSRFQRQIVVQNADLTMVGSQVTTTSWYAGQIRMMEGSGRSNVTLRNTQVAEVYSNAPGDFAAYGSTIGSAAFYRTDGPVQNVQLGTADGSLPGNRVGAFSVSGPYNLGLWGNTFTGDATATLAQPGSLAGARNTFGGNVSGDLTRLRTARTMTVRAGMDTSAQARTEMAQDKTQLETRGKRDASRATKHGSAHLKGRAKARH